MKQWTWKLDPKFLVKGVSTALVKQAAVEAGSVWERQAAVRFKESTTTGCSFVIRSRVKPGSWATWSPPYLTVSTWQPCLTAYAGMTDEELLRHFRSLFWHEFWHVMGGKSNAYTPAQMVAWTVKKYGPPVAKSKGK